MISLLVFMKKSVKSKKVRALGLLSGGLDSTVASKLLQEQGIEVVGVNFSTGFCVTDHHRAIQRKDRPIKKLRNEALRAGSDLSIPIDIIDISKKYFKEVVMNPKYGYGAGMNPCLDCRIYMLKKAKNLMKKLKADFVFTGEVLGQRPMSQYRHALDLVARKSGLGDKLLRPLSAQRLPETLPEKEGWVNREKLVGIAGRSRSEQIKLADEFGIIDFPQPAGGCCFLPDKTFATKLRDLLKYKNRFSKNDLVLLKVGRHFRISPDLKIIVGRDEAENNFLARFKRGHTLLIVSNTKGPTAIAQGPLEKLHQELAAKLVARYADPTANGNIEIEIRKGKKIKKQTVTALSNAEVDLYRIIPPVIEAPKITQAQAIVTP